MGLSADWRHKRSTLARQHIAALAPCCVTVDNDRGGARRDELWIESAEGIIKVENRSQYTFC